MKILMREIAQYRIDDDKLAMRWHIFDGTKQFTKYASEVSGVGTQDQPSEALIAKRKEVAGWFAQVMADNGIAEAALQPMDLTKSPAMWVQMLEVEA